MEAPIIRADLHCHSTCSDGTLSPKELVELAHASGLQGLSITDHDTIDAYRDLHSYARDHFSISLIHGIEFSCTHRNKSIHVLGYSFSLQNTALQAHCQKHRERREARHLKILALLEKNRIRITEQEIKTIAKGAPIGRPHIAQAIVNRGYALTVEEAFRKFIGDGKPCFVKSEAFPVEETIEIIHQAGGFAVIAHPHLIRNAIITRELLEMAFDGIECFYSRFSLPQNQIWVDIANKKGLFITGGSDFHGAIKPSIALGCSWTPENTFFHLLEKQRANDALS